MRVRLYLKMRTDETDKAENAVSVFLYDRKVHFLSYKKTIMRTSRRGKQYFVYRSGAENFALRNSLDIGNCCYVKRCQKELQSNSFKCKMRILHFFTIRNLKVKSSSHRIAKSSGRKNRDQHDHNHAAYRKNNG